MKMANQAAAGKAGRALHFQIEHDWPGLPEPFRWAEKPRVVCKRW